MSWDLFPPQSTTRRSFYRSLVLAAMAAFTGGPLIYFVQYRKAMADDFILCMIKMYKRVKKRR